MPNDAGIITYALYENGKEYLGHAKVTLPDKSYKTATISGAGVAGEVNVPYKGQVDAMTTSIEFIDNPKAAYELATPRVHKIDCRSAHEVFDEKSGMVKISAHKHVMEIFPTVRTGGTIAPATPQGSKVDFSVLSWKEYIDGKLVSEIDALRNRDIGPDGKDNLAEVRSALGK